LRTLDVADVLGGLGQQRTLLDEQGRCFNRMVRGHRADRDLAAALANVAQSIDAPDVYDVFRLCQAKLHRGNQAVTAGEQLGVLAVPLEERDRFVHRRGPQIFERSGKHLFSPGGSERTRPS